MNINYIQKKIQINKLLSQYSAFRNGCFLNNINCEDLAESVFIGCNTDKYKKFTDYYKKKYNLKQDLEVIPQTDKCVCGKKIKNFFYLYNEKKNIVLKLGSECITHFIETKLHCINCKRTNAKHLERGLCCDCLKIVCHKCFKHNIVANNMCRKCHRGRCRDCLKPILNQYKKCQGCNIKEKQLCHICNKNYHNIKFFSCFKCFKSN
jgi:hypothetical protein